MIRILRILFTKHKDNILEAVAYVLRRTVFGREKGEKAVCSARDIECRKGRKLSKQGFGGGKRKSDGFGYLIGEVGSLGDWILRVYSCLVVELELVLRVMIRESIVRLCLGF